jgi:UDP-arabinose 4-epimerase
MTILVVGGAGYIGPHVCKALKEADLTPVVYDNLSNGHDWAVKWGPLVKGELSDAKALDEVFTKYRPKGVIHLASCICVKESMDNPEKYHQNNVEGTRSLLEAMVRNKVDQIVFSSSAAVYGHPEQEQISESHPCKPINFYGETKLLAEQILADFFKDYQLRSVTLRYFNAAGADESGEIGEAHTPETHLIPQAIFAALNNTTFKIFGTDHPTADGTPIRDFIHVSDLAKAHVLALQWLINGGTKISINIGSGKGYSVKEVLAAIEQKVGPFAQEIAPRNPFDPPILVADISVANKILNWTPTMSDLDTIISSALKWHKKHIQEMKSTC